MGSFHFVEWMCWPGFLFLFDNCLLDSFAYLLFAFFADLSLSTSPLLLFLPVSFLHMFVCCSGGQVSFNAFAAFACVRVLGSLLLCNHRRQQEREIKRWPQ